MPLPTLAIPGFDGLSHTVNTPNSGRQAAADSAAAALSNEDYTALNGILTKLNGTVAVTQSGTWNIGSITTLPALPTGANVIGGVTQSGTWNITNISGTVSLPTGAATSANQSALNTNIGSSSDAAVANGSGGSVAGYLRAIKDAATDNTTPSPVKIDQTTDGITNAVAVKNSPSANTAKTYTGSFVVAATGLTRPANVTAYSIGDSISNNATAASVTANSVSLSDTNDHPIDLAEILLDTTDTGPGTAGAKITLHLFNSDPTASTGVVGGDNAAWSNKKAGWVGSFSGTMTPFSDGSRAVLTPDAGTLRMISPTSGAKTVFWQLQTQTAFTPSANSTVFTPTFKGFQARPA
jgi:hypothetical protein